MGIDKNFAIAFAKSQLGAGSQLPQSGTVFISVKDSDKRDDLLHSVRELVQMGFEIVATGGTLKFLQNNEIGCRAINKVHQGRPHIVDAMKNGEIALVFNTTEGAKAVSDSFPIRRTALLYHIPYYTTLAGATSVVKGIVAMSKDELQVASIQSLQKSGAH